MKVAIYSRPSECLQFCSRSDECVERVIGLFKTNNYDKWNLLNTNICQRTFNQRSIIFENKKIVFASFVE